MRAFFLSVFFMFALLPGAALANKDSFQVWLVAFKKEALRKGISESVLESAFKGVKPLPRVIELDRKQPEGKMTFAQYKAKVISKDRIIQGRKLYAQHRETLDAIAEKYGVPAPYILALWGMETSYGNNTGGFGVIPALATLAHDGRRSTFFRGELLAALTILEQGHISLKDMKGSWAGAMGQNQFMPSSFHAYAVDEDGDGRRDIWTTRRDVFASTANYLSKSGWRGDERWGRPVKLPAKFPVKLVGTETRKSLKEWNKLGVRLPNGEKLPDIEKMSASVVAPDGIGGPAFLAYHNFGVIMKWNRSQYFAVSVGTLADAIAE
ncbi:MAG: lytic murein transglycosylase [Alphaproteobacteria bacterium]|nr:lytic murein transglycosylase [Alphaproteobacteria bacterium]MBP7757687.1 lytic murein transglycosylase [Alphaproteobacteria bacterium]MBP7761113.1 lytic murein transglycosylase [Alphaproteobacteria bacterium]MBP7904723.1 lytic murein transglycosylase [Alphaproteobacteria bacterium]